MRYKRTSLCSMFILLQLYLHVSTLGWFLVIMAGHVLRKELEGLPVRGTRSRLLRGPPIREPTIPHCKDLKSY